MLIKERILLHLPDSTRIVVDPDEVYFLEAERGRTRIRSRSDGPVYDVRQIAELLPLFAPHGFLRIHRSFVVNLRRVQEIRPRDNPPDWELKMEPPVNIILPIARSSLHALWAAYGD